MAELQSLTVSLQDSFSAGAAAVAQAADKMATAMDKAAGSNTTTDTALRTRGQSLDSVTTKIDGAAAATARLEQVERRYQAQVQVLTQGMQAQGKSAGEIAEAISRLGTIRDQDAAKARAQGQAIEQRFAPAAAATDKLAASTKGGAMALRDMAMQGQDLFVQLASGGNVFTALIQQGSQVSQQMMAAGQGFGALKSAASIALGAVLSPMGLLVTGAVAATGAIAALAAAGESQLGMLARVQQSLRGTQDNYMALGQTVLDVARKVSASSGLGLDEATKATQTIAQGKYFAGTAADLERLTRDAEDFGTKLGGAAAGAKYLADAMLDPAKAAQSVYETLGVRLDPELTRHIELTQSARGKGAAWAELLGELEKKLSGTARDGLGPIAKAWQDLGNAVTSSSDGWKAVKDWFTNDVALAIQNIATAITAVKTAWQTFRQGMSTDQGGMQSPTMPPTTNDNAVNVDPEYLRNRSQPVAVPGLRVSGTPELVTRETNGIRYTVAAEFASQVDGFLRELASSGYAISTVQGFNNRNIAGTDTKSYHAYGAAFDINPAQNPVNGGTDMPPNIREMAARYGLGWGGAWTGGKTDPMHFSFAKSEGGAYDISRSGPIPTLAGGGMLSETKADADAMNEYVKASRAWKDLQLDAAFARLNAQQQQLASTTGTDTAEYKAVTQELQKNRAERHANVDELTAAQRQSESSLRSTQGLTAADQALNAAMESRRQVSLQMRGEDLSAADATQVRTNVLKAQAQEYERTTHSITEATANQAGMLAAYRQGNAAVGEATAMQQAYTKAVELFGQNIPEGKFQELTQFYQKLAAVTADAKTAQQNLQLGDNLAYIQAETSSLGENENARTKQLAVLKATQDQLREHNGVLTEEAQRYIALTGTIADATAAYQLQQNSLNEVKSFFSNTFDTIGNAITQAFATGNLAALKFKDIAKSVASAVISEFAKLAIINPLKNLLTGGNDPTLSSVGGILGKLLGSGSTSNADLPAGEVGLAATASGVSALESLGFVNSLSGSTPGQLASADNASTASSASGGLTGELGKAAFGKSLESFASSLVTKTISAIGGEAAVSAATSAATNAALGTLESTGAEAVAGGGAGIGAVINGGAVSGVVGASTGQIAGAAVGQAIGGSDATVAALSTAAGKVADAIPYIGVAISVITDLVKGNYRGAGLVAGGAAAGAAVGTFVFPGLGTAAGAAIGATLGGIVDAILPNHPLHPFDATAVNVQDGQLTVGKTATQAEGANSLGQVQNFVTGVNTFMAKAGIILANGNGQLGAIGDGIAGMVGLVKDPNQLLAALSFKNNPNDTSQFGVAKGALEGMSFPNGQALQDEIIKIAAFADATEAVGIKLASVGKDITNINIEDVYGYSPGDTKTTTGAHGEEVRYQSDVRTALHNDLPGQTFADTSALDAEIAKVNQFVNGTIPGLLHPVSQTTSAIVDEAHKLERAYQDAIDQSLKYGLDNTKVLQDAAVEALKIVRKSGIDQIGNTTVQLADRLAVASGGGQAALDKQALDNFDIQAQKQRDDFSKLLTDTYGDEVKTWSGYAENMALLEATLGAERLQVVKQTAGGIVATNGAVAASYQNLFDLVASYAARIKSATGDQQGADLDNFDMKAAQERVAFIKEFTDAFGQAILADGTFQAQLATVDAAHYAERLQLHQKYVDQAMAQQKALDDVVTSIDARGLAASGDQRGADLLGFDMKARQEVDAFNQQFKEHYGEAYAATADYQQNITKLEEVQGQERLAIIKKYADAATSTTDAALKTAQGNVTQLFTSLNDYTTRLKNSDQSPLSPTARYDLASSQFNAVAGAAAAGDAKSAGQLTGYSDALLTASRSVYGSGQQYVADFNRVLDAIQNVTMVPDQLTQSFMTLALQTQTQALVSSLQAVQDEIAALRREFANQTRLQSLAA